MNLVIPFESKCKFDSAVKEICSISLEHEHTINDDGILGNFLISGTYKEHELSANILDFNFTVPFSVDITEEIDRTTIDFTIDNFTYDIDDNEMSVKIDYIVSAENMPHRNEVEIDIDEIFSEKENTSEPTIEKIIQTPNYINTNDDFDTYQIHFVKENESLDTICAFYKVSINEIMEINDINEVHPNDKILIPMSNE